MADRPLDDEAAPDRRARAPRGNGERSAALARARLAVLLVVLLVAAVVADRSATTTRATVSPATIGPPATLAADNVRSAAWYCPLAAPTATIGTHDAVVVANIGRAGVVTEISGVGQLARRAVRRVRIEPGAPLVLAASSLAGPHGEAVVVEPFGPGIVVEHRVQTARGVAVGACGTTLSPRWFFAALTTRLGATSTVALLNPLAHSDAVVDVTLYTSVGARAPTGLQGLEVPRRSRVLFSLNDYADRQDVVAVAVRARSGGRVAAEAAVAQDGRLAVVLGAASRRSAWWLASGAGGEARALYVLNPNDVTATVAVQVVPVGASQTIPTTVHLEAGTAIALDLGRLAADRDYSVYVLSPTSAPVVVGDLAALGPARAPVGLGSVVPAASGARTWAFAAGALDGLTDVTVLVLDTSARAASVTVTAGDGRRHHLRVAPGDRAIVALPATTTGPITVESDEPVVVERSLRGINVATVTAGIPSAS